jgi:hypothetical protein
MEKSIPEIEVKAEQASTEQVSTSAIGNVSYWRIEIGPRQGDVSIFFKFVILFKQN